MNALADRMLQRGLIDEAAARGYRFDRSKIGPVRGPVRLTVTEGQMEYEWKHLLGKLKSRSPAEYRKWMKIRRPDPHPLFRVRPGAIAEWERPRPSAGALSTTTPFSTGAVNA